MFAMFDKPWLQIGVGFISRPPRDMRLMKQMGNPPSVDQKSLQPGEAWLCGLRGVGWLCVTMFIASGLVRIVVV